MTMIDKLPDNFKYNNEVLDHLKKVELEMLKDFIEICEKNNLTYFIHCGSALGAVRHGGFIPWDDEIDLLMPREDYEKFLEIIGTENKKYYLSNWRTEINIDNKYLTPKSLLCLKNTKLSQLGDTGIYIDISVLDEIPQGKYKIKYFMKKMKLLYYLMNLLLTINADRYSSKNKKMIGHFLGSLFKLIHFTPNFIAKIFTKNIKKYHNKSECTLDMTIYYEKPIPKKFFNEVTKIKFEDVLVNIPKDYDYILRQYYGNYMELPPKEERRIHYYGEIDFGEY